jgi:hypothetical protein
VELCGSARWIPLSLSLGKNFHESSVGRHAQVAPLWRSDACMCLPNSAPRHAPDMDEASNGELTVIAGGRKLVVRRTFCTLALRSMLVLFFCQSSRALRLALGLCKGSEH